MQNRAKIALAAAVTALAATAALWPTEAGLICEVVCNPDTTAPLPPAPPSTEVPGTTEADSSTSTTGDLGASSGDAGSSTGDASTGPVESTGPTGP